MDYEKEKKMIEKTNCDEVDKKIRATIDKIIEKYKGNHQTWNDERHVHYDFFKFLFDEFPPEQIKRNFVWEYQVGKPKEEVDLGMFCGNRNLVLVDFKLNLSPGDKKEGLEKELIKCIEKLQSSPKCLKSMFRGYVVPLLYRDAQATAPRYNGITYQELCSKNIQKAENSIKVSNIKLISDGVMPLDKR